MKALFVILSILEEERTLQISMHLKQVKGKIVILWGQKKKN